MTSRRQKIHKKRKQEEKEIQQVRIAVGIFVVLLVLAIIAYVLAQSGVFDPPAARTANLGDVTGTPQAICDQATPSFTGGEDGQYSEAPAMTLDPDKDYQAIFCTSQGAIYIDLFEDVAPITVNNFVFLANNDYYNNTIFHRVLEGFMAQGGDPTGSGRGGPGYTFVDETRPDVLFDRPYLLAMANAGPGTNGSQFFITFVPTPHLNGAHTIFGEVLSGQAVVDSLTRVDPQRPNAQIAPSTLDAVVIVSPDQVTP